MVGDDEVKVRSERARAIGLFRYQLIREAADAAHSAEERGKMVRELASRDHADPFGRRVRVSRQTIDRWIRDWRAGGFDALVPNQRQCTRVPRRRCWSWRWRCGGRTRSAPPRRSAGSCGPSWAGHPMNVPCNVTFTGSALSVARPRGRRRCSGGSKPSTPMPCGLGMRCTAYPSKSARPTYKLRGIRRRVGRRGPRLGPVASRISLVG